MTPLELKKLRTDHKITRLELAAHTGIFTQQIQRIEDEEIVPLDSDLQRMESGLRRLIEGNAGI